MFSKLRPRSVYDVLAALAFFAVVAGGSAYAAATIGSSQIKNNAILSRHIKNGQVKASDLAANSVGGGKIIDGSVSNADLAPNSVGTTNVIDGSLLARDFKAGELPSWQPGDALPSGKTETGAWSIFDGSASADMYEGVTLPFPARAPLSDATVNFQANSNNIASDDDSTCTGTAQTPTAPPGKVCIYLAHGSANAGALSGKAIGNPGPSNAGFVVYSTVADTDIAAGTWAYTAP